MYSQVFHFVKNGCSLVRKFGTNMLSMRVAGASLLLLVSGAFAQAAPLAADHTILYYLVEMERHSNVSCDGTSVSPSVSLTPSEGLRSIAESIARGEIAADSVTVEGIDSTMLFVATNVNGAPQQAVGVLKVQSCSAIMNERYRYIGAAKRNGAWVVLMSAIPPNASAGVPAGNARPNAARTGKSSPADITDPNTDYGMQKRVAIPGDEVLPAEVLSTSGAASQNGNLRGGRPVSPNAVPVETGVVLDDYAPAGANSGYAPARAGEHVDVDIPKHKRSATESMPADSPESFIGKGTTRTYKTGGDGKIIRSSEVVSTPAADGDVSSAVPADTGASAPSGKGNTAGKGRAIDPNIGESLTGGSAVGGSAGASEGTSGGSGSYQAPEPPPQYLQRRPGITPLHDADPARPVELLPTDKLGQNSPVQGNEPLPDIGHKIEITVPQ